MSSALTVIRQRALYELNVGGVIPNGDISAIAATTVTSVKWAQNTNLAADYFQINNTGLFRFGAATAADAYRPAGTIANTTGVISQVGANWSDTTLGTEEVEYAFYGARLDVEWLKSINRVTAHDFITTYLAISHLSGLDGDMQLSTDTNWNDEGTTTTSAKSTTGALTPWGQRSYNTINSVANSGTRSATVRGRQSGPVIAHTIAGTEVGTSSIQGYDVTGAAAIGGATTSNERKPQLMTWHGTLPSTSKAWQVMLTNSATLGNTFWNQAWLFNQDDLVCPLPALLTESFMAPHILMGVPTYSTGSNIYDAGSLDFRELKEGVDYWYVIAPSDAVPYKIRFASNVYYDYPLFVEARIPQSSLLTLSAESDALTGPLERIVPRFKKDLLETVYNIGPRRHPDWVVQHNLAIEQLGKASNSRPLVSVAAARPWAPRLGAS